MSGIAGKTKIKQASIERTTSWWKLFLLLFPLLLFLVAVRLLTCTETQEWVQIQRRQTSSWWVYLVSKQASFVFYYLFKNISYALLRNEKMSWTFFFFICLYGLFIMYPWQHLVPGRVFLPTCARWVMRVVRWLFLFFLFLNLWASLQFRFTKSIKGCFTQWLHERGNCSSRQEYRPIFIYLFIYLPTFWTLSSFQFNIGLVLGLSFLSQRHDKQYNKLDVLMASFQSFTCFFPFPLQFDCVNLHPFVSA